MDYQINNNQNSVPNTPVNNPANNVPPNNNPAPIMQKKTTASGGVPPKGGNGIPIVWGIIIIMAIAVIAFGGVFAYQYFATQNSPTVVEQNPIQTTPPATVLGNSVTISDINSATYTIAGTQAQFSDGKFHPERNSAASADQGLNAVISSYAFGDINGDDQGDAVIVTEYGMGARDARTDTLQIVLNANGKPQAINVTIPGHTGDNFAVGFSVTSIDTTGLITLQLAIPNSSSNQYDITQVNRTYRYVNGALLESGSQTAGWKVYTSDTYGFSFQYPDVSNLSILKDGSIMIDQGTYGDILIKIPHVFGTPGYPDTFNDLKNRFSGAGYNEADISVGKIQGIRVSSSQIGDIVYIPFSGNKIFEIDGNFKNPVFNQLLSTFKFTNSTDQTAGWKTYTNSNLGISFQYPEKFNTTFASFNQPPTAIITTNGSKQIDTNGCYIDSVLVGTEVAGKNDSLVTINGLRYCVSTYGDPGAGQLYTTSNYTFLKDGNYITLQYVVHTSYGCDAYMGTPNYQPCIDFGNNYDTIVVKPIKDSVATLKFTNQVLADQLCNDSDGGEDHYVKGTTTGTSIWGDKGPFTDSCITGPNSTYDLQEWSCVDNGHSVIGTGFKCPKGCLNGACIK